MSILPTNDRPEKGFAPVSASHPCPICGKPDWCLISVDGTVAICQRTEAGSVKRCGDAGWLHRLSEPAPRPPAGKQRNETPRDWPAEAARYAAALTPADADWLLARLGLPPAALDAVPQLGVCRRDPAGPVTTWPEADADGVVIGVNRRIPGVEKDEKKMLTGGKRGLTLPLGWCSRPGPAFVVEGPTDAAALTAAGLSAVGRPSKDGGGKLLAKLFAGWPADRGIVVVGENDAPSAESETPGIDAAVRLARRLAIALGRLVLVTLPPAGSKDVRG